MYSVGKYDGEYILKPNYDIDKLIDRLKSNGYKEKTTGFDPSGITYINNKYKVAVVASSPAMFYIESVR